MRSAVGALETRLLFFLIRASSLSKCIFVSREWDAHKRNPDINGSSESIFSAELSGESDANITRTLMLKSGSKQHSFALKNSTPRSKRALQGEAYQSKGCQQNREQ